MKQKDYVKHMEDMHDAYVETEIGHLSRLKLMLLCLSRQIAALEEEAVDAK